MKQAFPSFQLFFIKSTATFLVISPVWTVLAACSSDNSTKPTSAQPDATSGGASGAGNTSSTSQTTVYRDTNFVLPPPVVQAIPATLTSGTRLRLRYWQLDDGTKLLRGIQDAEKNNEECEVRPLDAQRWACIPKGSGSLFPGSILQTLYEDSECKKPIFVSKEEVDYLVIPGANPTSNCSFSIRKSNKVEDTITTYYDNRDGSCRAETSLPNILPGAPSKSVPPSDYRYRPGDEAMDAWASVNATRSLTPEGFAFWSMQSEDGATFWLPYRSQYECNPSVATGSADRFIIGAGLELGSGVLRARYDANSTDDFGLFNLDRSLERCATLDPTTPGPTPCVPKLPKECNIGPNYLDAMYSSSNLFLDAGCSAPIVDERSILPYHEFCWVRQYDQTTGGTLRRVGMRYEFPRDNGVAVFHLDYLPFVSGQPLTKGCLAVPPTDIGYPRQYNNYVQVLEEIPLTTFPSVLNVQE